MNLGTHVVESKSVSLKVNKDLLYQPMRNVSIKRHSQRAGYVGSGGGQQDVTAAMLAGYFKNFSYAAAPKKLEIFCHANRALKDTAFNLRSGMQ